MKRLRSQGSSGSSGHQDEESDVVMQPVMHDSDSCCASVAPQSENRTCQPPDCSNDTTSLDLTLHQPAQTTSSASQGDTVDALDSQLSFESTVDTTSPASPRHTPAAPVDSASVLMLALVPLVPQGDGDAAGGPPVPMYGSNNGDGSGDDEEDDDDDDATEAMNMETDEDPFETASGEPNGANMFGFHHCDVCVPFATCDVCHHVLRTRRLLRNDESNSAEHVYQVGAHGLHICTHCHLVGMCDVCHFMLRDERSWPLPSSGRARE